MEVCQKPGDDRTSQFLFLCCYFRKEAFAALIYTHEGLGCYMERYHNIDDGEVVAFERRCDATTRLADGLVEQEHTCQEAIWTGQRDSRSGRLLYGFSSTSIHSH